VWYNFFGDIMLIDSHCHVLSSEYENPLSVIEDALKAGVDKIIINGYDVKSSIEAVSLANKYENVYASVGISPQNVDDLNDNAYDMINELIVNDKVVAVGEIGLDYYWTKENKDTQILVFKKMLEIAKKHDLPVIVHSRKAFLDTYNLLKEYNVNGILHCYSGSLEMAHKFINLGFLLGIGGVITFKNAKILQEVVKNIDVKYLSLETDSPYLSPEPYRGKKNTPKNVVLVAEKIAQIKGVSKSEVIRISGEAVSSKFDL
jgi:TatD DNase family protein